MHTFDVMFKDKLNESDFDDYNGYERSVEWLRLCPTDIAKCISEGNPIYDSIYLTRISDLSTNTELHSKWYSQQLFVLAINDSIADELIAQARFLAVPVSMIIEGSLNGGPKLKYAVFLLQQPIKDLRMRYVVIASLRKLFIKERLNYFKTAVNETFNSFDSLRFTESEVLYVNDDASIDTLHLIETTCCKIHVDGGSHGDRDLNDFLASIYLLMSNRGVLLKIADKRSYLLDDLSAEPDGYHYDIKTEHINARIYFRLTANDFMRMAVDKLEPLGEMLSKDQVEFVMDNVNWDVVKDIGALIANSGCIYLNKIVSGEKLIDLEELRAIAIELSMQKGIQTVVTKRLRQLSLYDKSTLKMLERFMERYRRIVVGDVRIPCQSFCCVRDDCCERQGFVVEEILDILPQKPGSIRKLLREERIAESAKMLRHRLQQDFEADLCLDADIINEEEKEIEALIADLGEDDLSESIDIDETWGLFEGEEVELNETHDEEPSGEIYVYKCFVGLGKTQMYVSKAKEFIDNKRSVIIAFPNHDLKDDVLKRIKQSLKTKALKKKVIDVPMRPSINSDMDQRINQLYRIGATRQVNELIRSYIKNNIMSSPKENWTDADKQLIAYATVPKLLHRKNYLKGKVILCTHERLFQLMNLKPDYWIIDEDITNSLLKQGSVPVSELQRLREHLRTAESVPNSSVIEIIDKLISTESNQMYGLQHEVREWQTVNQVLTANRSDFDTNISELLFDATAYVKQTRNFESEADVDFISYIRKRELKLSGKLFIMSATANESIYRRLFGEDIHFRNYGIPKLKAEFRQMYRYSYSRSWTKNNQGIVSLLEKRLLDNDDFEEDKRFLSDLGLEREDWQLKEQFLVITHLPLENEFKRLGYANTIHFGKTTGIDEYNGSNLIVFGTPHVNPISYALINKVLYPEDALTEIPRIQRNVLVNRNGYQFFFTTSPEASNFREIQFWMIESELIQAIGRARPIDNKCKIYVWTNLPLPDLDISFERWDEGL